MAVFDISTYTQEDGFCSVACIGLDGKANPFYAKCL